MVGNQTQIGSRRRSRSRSVAGLVPRQSSFDQSRFDRRERLRMQEVRTRTTRHRNMVSTSFVRPRHLSRRAAVSRRFRMRTGNRSHSVRNATCSLSRSPDESRFRDRRRQFSHRHARSSATWRLVPKATFSRLQPGRGRSVDPPWQRDPLRTGRQRELKRGRTPSRQSRPVAEPEALLKV